MKNWKKGLAVILALLMLVTALPLTVLADDEVTAVDAVIYNLLDCPVAVDEFEADGSYTIRLEDNAFYPYEVQFTIGGESQIVWFDTPDSEVRVGGHIFRTVSNSTDETLLKTMGLWIGDEYVPAYPDGKTFSDTPQAQLMTLLPVSQRNLQINLEGHTPAELRLVKLETVFHDELENEHLAGTERVAWAEINGDEYEIAELSDGINLRSMMESWDCDKQFEMYVGSAKQLDKNNVCYNISIKTTPFENWLVPTLYKEDAYDGSRVEIGLGEVLYSSEYQSSIAFYDLAPDATYTFEIDGTLTIGVSENRNFVFGETSYIYLGLEFAEQFANAQYTYKVYEGDCTSGTDITDQILNQNMANSNSGIMVGLLDSDRWIINDCINVFTVYVFDGEEQLGYEQFWVDLSVSNDHFGIYNSLRNADGESVAYNTEYKGGDNTIIATHHIYEEYDAGAEYYQKFYYYSGNQDDDAAVEIMVDGYYESVEELREAVKTGAVNNIKNECFNGNGYLRRYDGDGVVFTLLIDGKLYYAGILAVQGNESKVQNESETVGSSDTYFNINGARELSEENYYRVPFAHDSYGIRGYQTVLVLDGDVASLTPTFSTGSNITMYAGTSADTTTTQESGVNSFDFSQQSIYYSAASENGMEVKNYWVSFVPKSNNGAELFINGIHSSTQEGDGYRRELFLDSYYGGHHDIFLANIGNESLTGLKAELTDAQNVKLDPYWTVGGENNNSLAPFTSTSPSSMENIAKVRLVPDGSGMISGKLTISADGQDPITFNLTGVAGDPQILTTEIPTGVKYVPYGTMIQTSNQYDWNKVHFELLSGRLPSGMTLRPNGEIYGVPTETGTFTFRVSMENSEPDFPTSYATYTLKIAENTDENLAAQTDEGYSIQTRVPDFTAYSNQEFKIEGELSEFIDLWLDGKKLESGVDYDVEEGSTKTTIFAQTFEDAGSGTHTIAAEFRVDGDANKDLKKAAQNYTKTDSTTHSTPSRSSASSNPQVAPAVYDISVKSAENGEVSISHTEAKAKTTVTITTTPSDGYELETVTVSDANGNSIALTKNSTTIYTFIMPSSAINVECTFAKRYDPTVDTKLPFSDIYPGVWYTDGVSFAYENGLMLGTSGSKFSPDISATRAMFVTVLYRLVGEPEVNGECEFEDVSADSYYEDAVTWATENEIVKGCGEAQFKPNSVVTREQMVTILYNYAKRVGMDVGLRADLHRFDDCSDISEFAEDAMSWANAAGIIVGTSTDTLSPQGDSTRAQIAVVVKRFCEYVQENNSLS